MSFVDNLKYNINYILKDRKLNQSDFGKSVGISQIKVSSILNDTTKIIPLELAVNISKVYGYSIDDLMFNRIDFPYKQYEDFVRKNNPQLANDSVTEENGYGIEGIDPKEFKQIKALAEDTNEKITELYNMVMSNANKNLLEKSLANLKESAIPTQKKA